MVSGAVRAGQSPRVHGVHFQSRHAIWLFANELPMLGSNASVRENTLPTVSR